MADGAADSYDFTCEGALADDASEGKVSCVDCPVCIGELNYILKMLLTPQKLHHLCCTCIGPSDFGLI